MKAQVQISIKANAKDIWKVITNIENSINVIEAIKEIEIINKPDNGIVGIKWTEKRVMFGKEASETMWIIEAKTNEYYITQAESHGSVYNTKLSITPSGNENILAMEFSAKPQIFSAKLMWALTGFIFKNATVKALQKDLEDIKKTVNNGSLGGLNTIGMVSV